MKAHIIFTKNSTPESRAKALELAKKNTEKVNNFLHDAVGYTLLATGVSMLAYSATQAIGLLLDKKGGE